MGESRSQVEKVAEPPRDVDVRHRLQREPHCGEQRLGGRAEGGLGPQDAFQVRLAEDHVATRGALFTGDHDERFAALR